MARIRTIKPEFFTHSSLGALSAHHRLIFIGLWTQADREGRLKDDVKKLKVVLLPYDDVDIDKILTDLNDNPEKFITRYEVKGEKYIQINNFLEHQHPHVKELESTIPAPYKHRASTSRAPVEPSASTSLAPVEPSASTSLAPVEPGGREGKGKEGKGKEGDIGKEGSKEGNDNASPHRASPLTDEDFILKLKENDAYKHIDIDMELKKMDAWLIPRPHRKKTRTFIVKWLNRIERPLNTGLIEKPVINIRQRVKELKEEHAKKGV